jgi:hypothetical protein
MVLWRIYINYVLIDVAMFCESIIELDALNHLINFGGFDPLITIKKSNEIKHL